MDTIDRTIAALATPPGIAGLSVIRVSGGNAFPIVQSIFHSQSIENIAEMDSHKILYGQVADSEGLIDTVTLSLFKGPNSYTGEDTIEIGSHGGNFVYRRILDALYANGAHPAGPGEFTKRAFVNGKLDLTQVEAVADLIHSESEQGAKLAASQLTGSMKRKLEDVNRNLKRAAGLLELELDFSEEEAGFIDRDELDKLLSDASAMCNELASGQKSADILRSGLHVAIVGLPNAGKSTLFNALLGEERAITSPIAGTTRDYIKESLLIGGGTVHLYDTAGIRESDDIIEIEGIKLVESVLSKAGAIVLLYDLAEENDSKTLDIYNSISGRFGDTKKILLVGTKSDLVDISTATQKVDIFVSGKEGSGLDNLIAYFSELIEKTAGSLGNTLVNARQAELLKKAAKHIDSARILNSDGDGNELIGYEIRDAAKEISWITGERWSEQVLNDVFAGFCIGK